MYRNRAGMKGMQEYYPITEEWQKRIDKTMALHLQHIYVADVR